MICSTKTEFLTGLRMALEKNNVTDTRDILTDFRQHFEDGEAAGESEADVCRKLGDIDEIIKQYISEDAEQKAAMPDSSGFGAEAAAIPAQNAAAQGAAQSGTTPPSYYNVQPTNSGANAGKIIGVICLDLFVFSWAIPGLFGVIMGLFGTTIGFVLGGLGVFVSGLLSFFVDLSGLIVTGFVPLSLIFLGILLLSLGGMLVIGSIAAGKGFINLCIAIINLHGKAIVGHPVLEKIGKKED
jgi:uncharacterized membrane protein